MSVYCARLVPPSLSPCSKIILPAMRCYLSTCTLLFLLPFSPQFLGRSTAYRSSCFSWKKRQCPTRSNPGAASARKGHWSVVWLPSPLSCMNHRDKRQERLPESWLQEYWVKLLGWGRAPEVSESYLLQLLSKGRNPGLERHLEDAKRRDVHLIHLQKAWRKLTTSLHASLKLGPE